MTDQDAAMVAVRAAAEEVGAAVLRWAVAAEAAGLYGSAAEAVEAMGRRLAAPEPELAEVIELRDVVDLVKAQLGS